MVVAVQVDCGPADILFAEPEGKVPMVTFTCRYEIPLSALLEAAAYYEAPSPGPQSTMSSPSSTIGSKGVEGRSVIKPRASAWLNHGADEKLREWEKTYAEDPPQTSVAESKPEARNDQDLVRKHVKDGDDSSGTKSMERVHEQHFQAPSAPPPPKMPPPLPPQLGQLGVSAESSALQGVGVSWNELVMQATTTSSIYSDPMPRMDPDASKKEDEDLGKPMETEESIATKLLNLSDSVLHALHSQTCVYAQVSKSHEDNVLSAALHGMATHANKLKDDVFEVLADGMPRNIEDVVSINDISTRFKSLFGDQLEDDSMCMAWLTSFRSVKYYDALRDDYPDDYFIYLQNDETSEQDAHDIWLRKLWEKARDVNMLEADVLNILDRGDAKKANDILSERNIGGRFNEILGLPRELHVDDLWTCWLNSIPRVDFVEGAKDYVCSVSGPDVLEHMQGGKQESSSTQPDVWDVLAIERWLNDGKKTWKQALLQIGSEGQDADLSPAISNDRMSDFAVSPKDGLEPCTESPRKDVFNSTVVSPRVENATSSEKSSTFEWLVIAPGSFDAPNGKNTKEAKQLEKDVLDLLADGSPQVIGKLYARANMGTRFTAVFFRGQNVRKTFWKKWLGTLPGVELVHDASIPTKDVNDMEHVYARRLGAEGSEPVHEFDALEALNLLKGTWKSIDGSTYEVTTCLHGKSLSVKMTRPTGQIEFRKGVISGSASEVTWGIGFKLSQVSATSAYWQGRSRNYEWTRIK